MIAVSRKSALLQPAPFGSEALASNNCKWGLFGQSSWISRLGALLIRFHFSDLRGALNFLALCDTLPLNELMESASTESASG
jgi:hypothetical protein